MPKPPLIASERTRAGVIAAVMLVLLAASLGLAYGLVVLPAPARYDLIRGAPQHVGNLTIAIPQGWRPTDLGGDFKDFEIAARFSDRHNALRQMIVGVLVLPEPKAPIPVMQYVLATMLGRTSAREIVAGPAIRELQVGNMVGLRYTDATQTAEGIQERFVAVMTADGRRQWVIVLNQPIETPSLLKQRILADDQAFEKICESASLPKALAAPVVPGTTGPPGAMAPGATTRHEENP